MFIDGQTFKKLKSFVTDVCQRTPQRYDKSTVNGWYEGGMIQIK